MITPPDLFDYDPMEDPLIEISGPDWEESDLESEGRDDENSDEWTTTDAESDTPVSAYWNTFESYRYPSDDNDQEESCSSLNPDVLTATALNVKNAGTGGESGVPIDSPVESEAKSEESQVMPDLESAACPQLEPGNLHTSVSSVREIEMTETLNASINPPVAKCGESIEASAQTHQVATGIATASVPAIDETEIPPENLDVQIAEPLASPLEAEDSESEETEPEYVSDDDETDQRNSSDSSKAKENSRFNGSGSVIATETEIMSDGASIVFDLSCIVCYKAYGTLSFSCTLGHALCRHCFTSGEFTKCPAVIGNPEDKETCGYDYYEIDDAYLKTPYYKMLDEALRYHCKYASRGCDVGTSRLLMDQHVSDCSYRLLDCCQFKSHGCTSAFESLAEYVKHVVKEHGVRVSLTSPAYMLLPINQNEFQQPESVEEKSTFLHVRAEFRYQCRNYDYKVAFVTRDLGNGMTRLSFVLIQGNTRTERLRAHITIYQHSWEELDEDSIKAHLAVAPSLGMLESQSKNINGLAYFVDIDHRDLEQKADDQLPQSCKKAVYMAIAIFEATER